MKYELKLKEKTPDQYVVASLPDGTMFVHDKESGENFFNQKTIAKLCGLSQRMVSHHLTQYETFKSNIQNMYIALDVFNSNKPVNFYSFDCLTYVSFRSNKTEAIQMREYINSQLNRMFNHDVGFNQPKSLNQEAKEVIKQLQNKVIYHTTEAFKLMPKQNFQCHVDKANKYSIELHKRQLQLNNINNCNKRLKNELQLNKRGILTETGNKRVFLPETQTRLIDYQKR